MDIPARTAVRLDASARQAVATILPAITTPHRRPATVSDAIRAALAHAAAAIETTGGLRHAG